MSPAAKVEALWLPIGCFIAFSAFLFISAGFRFADYSTALIFLPYIVGWAAARSCARRGLSPRLVLAMTATAQCAVISAAGMMMAYAAAVVGRPLIDRDLLGFDQKLGYRWRDYAALVHSTPALRTAEVVAYSAIFIMPLLTIFALSIIGDERRIRRYLIATAVALTLVAAIFSLWPALTAWTYLGVGDREIEAFPLLPTAREGWERDLLEIRAGPGLLLHAFGSGLIAFPSFHCVAGVLFSWGLWPLRYARLPAMLLSGATIAAAPILGGHYIADLLAGGVVAIVSIAVGCRADLAFTGALKGRASQPDDASDNRAL